jgi:hypothetical protein
LVEAQENMNIKNKGGKTMKLKRTVFLLTVVVTMGLLLCASAVQAANVRYDPTNPQKVIEIRNLDIGGTFYNVTFPEQTTALELYGDFAGVYPFGDYAATVAAVDAVNAVLNAEASIPFYVGVEKGATDESTQIYLVGYSAMAVGGVETLDAYEGRNLDFDKWNGGSGIDITEYNFDEKTYADFRLVEERPPGNLDDTWYKGKINRRINTGWLTKNDGTLVKVRPDLQYFFKVCDEGSISDCGAVDYDVLLAIADFDGDEIFEADEVFLIHLATCGPDETSFVAELDITDDLDVDNDPATVEVFNQTANGKMRGDSNNKMLSKGCVWTADNALTPLDPDITGRKCRFDARPIDESELPFTLQDLVNEGVIADVNALDCSSTP